MKLSASLTILCLLIAVAFGQPAAGQPTSPSQTAKEQARLATARHQLEQIQQSLTAKQQQLTALQKQLAATKDDATKQALKGQIKDLQDSIQTLQQSFQNIALGGVDTSIFTRQANKHFDWRQELLDILRPLFDELKNVTEAPRAIERLRNELEINEQRLQSTKDALASIQQIESGTLSQPTQKQIKDLAEKWRQRQDDLQRRHDILRFQLNKLLGENKSVPDQIAQSLRSFFTGRGLTLLLAIVSFIVVWLALQGTLGWLQRRAERRGRRRPSTRARLGLLLFRMMTLLLAILAALLVFYVAGDLVLLGLALLLIVAMILSFRTYIPRYMAETRLILNLGAARERERVIYQGIPWRVRSLNIFSRLYNPELENGQLRLPTSEMLRLVSRTCREDEPWFPTRPNDYVILSDGTFGQVERQTPEIVQLKVMGSPVIYRTADFVAARPRNLSRGSFGVGVTFGVDYRHQADCLDELPQKLEQSVRTTLAESTVSDQVEDVLIAFKGAGASSLDYLIWVTMNGAAAGSYYAIGRLIQRACVAASNDNGWVIPFNQLVVHQGDGFDKLRSERALGSP